MATAIFICYSRVDEPWKDLLLRQLAVLELGGQAVAWHDGEIEAGVEWRKQIEQAIDEANIAIFLVSADSLSSAFIQEVEIPHILRLQSQGSLLLIPVLLRPCAWEQVSWLSALQMLPRDGRAIASGSDVEADEDLANVAREIAARSKHAGHAPHASSNPKPSSNDLNHLIRNYLGDFIAEMEDLNNTSLRGRYVLPQFDERDAGPSRRLDHAPPRPNQLETIHLIRQVVREMRGASRGGDQTTARLAGLSRSSRPVRNVIRRLRNLDEPVVLLGDPGSGKSMTIREVGIDMARRALKSATPEVIIYVRLGRYQQTSSGGPGDVLSFIASVLGESFQGRYAVIADLLPLLLNSERLVILFDGIDEMERGIYRARISALSHFALEHKRRAKTIFACRINDFSPDFTHRQLILAPFARNQVIEYVRKNLGRKIEVEGKTYSPAKFVARMSDNSAMGDVIQNPLVLYLLCNFVRVRKKWPRARAELFAEHVAGLISDLESAEHRLARAYPASEQLIRGWAALGFTITSHGGGVYGDRERLIEILGEEAVRWIDAGRDAGLLVEEPAARRPVRFLHHRLQEYFAAVYLDRERPELDWQPLIDTPRWQETLINLASFGGTSPALRVLADALPSSPQELEDPFQEYLLGDRVVLASEIIRNAGVASQSDPDDLAAGAAQPSSRARHSAAVMRLGALEMKLALLDGETISALTESAASSAQASAVASTVAPREREHPADAGIPEGLFVRFGRSALLLAERGRPPAQVKALWSYRNVPALPRAEVLRGPLESAVSWVREQALLVLAQPDAGLGEELGRELISDAAGGRFAFRFGSYLNILRVGQTLRWLPAVGWVMLVHLIYAGTALAILAGAFATSMKVLHDGEFSWNLPVGILALAFVVVETGLVSLGALKSWRPWTMLAAGTGMWTAVCALIATRNVGSIWRGAILFLIGWLAADGADMARAGLCAAPLAPWSGGAKSLCTAWSVAVARCDKLLWRWMCLVVIALIPFAIDIWLFQPELPPEDRNWVTSEAPPELVTSWTISEPTLNMPALVVLAIAAMLFVFAAGFAFIRYSRRAVSRARARRIVFVDAEQWVAEMRGADPYTQFEFLARTDHRSLRVTPQEMLRIYTDIADTVTEEPAASRLWRQIYDLEQQLRQTRLEGISEESTDGAHSIGSKS